MALRRAAASGEVGGVVTRDKGTSLACAPCPVKVVRNRRISVSGSLLVREVSQTSAGCAVLPGVPTPRSRSEEMRRSFAPLSGTMRAAVRRPSSAISMLNSASLRRSAPVSHALFGARSVSIGLTVRPLSWRCIGARAAISASELKVSTVPPGRSITIGLLPIVFS